MKIAIIVRRLNVNGGTQRQAVSLARELTGLGHNVTLYTLALDEENCYPHILKSLKVVTVSPVRTDATEPANGGAASQSAIYVATADGSRQRSNGVNGREVKRRGFLFLAAKFSGMFRESLMARELAFKIDKDTEILNPHDGIANRVACYFKKYVRDIPSVWSMNDVPLSSWVREKNRRLGLSDKFSLATTAAMRFQDFYEKVFARAQNAIVVLDNFNRNLVKKYLGSSSVVVRSGLDVDEFPFSARPPILGKKVSILTSGILYPHRRFEDVIEAVKILVEQGFDPSLSVIGSKSSSPHYFQKLTDLVKEWKLEDRVHFLGEVPEQELVRAYHSHDCFVFANDLQTWGLAVFEAMSSGLPVIVSRGAGAHEVLTDCQNCILVNPRDPENIARAIREFVLNPRLYQRLSAAGASFVRENISWRRYAEGMLKVFSESRKGIAVR